MATYSTYVVDNVTQLLAQPTAGPERATTVPDTDRLSLDLSVLAVLLHKVKSNSEPRPNINPEPLAP